MRKLTNYIMLVLLTISISGFSSLTYADKGGGGHGGHGKGVGHGHGKTSHTHYGKSKTAVNKSAKSAAHFTDIDRKKITNYFNTNPLSATNTTLPPGIAKNLARGKPLPPGIAKVFLPSEVSSTLPAYPGYEYRVVGDDVVLVNSTTEIVSDILTNVLK